MKKDSRIYVAGHKGLLGSAICRVLKANGFTNIITASREEVDLTHLGVVWDFFYTHEPQYVFLTAAKVGGIVGNSLKPVDFMTENLQIQQNVLRAAHQFNVEKLLFTASACAYPKLAKCPIKETDLLTGPLEPSNECYALAKIAGIKLCQAYRQQYGCNFIACMPTNLYGLGDHYDLTTSHVVPGMIRRIHEAKRAMEPVTLWGSGSPVREFLYADDMAEACLLLMEKYNSGDLINVGFGSGTTLRQLAWTIAIIEHFIEPILWDETRPDGTPVRLLDSSKIFDLGWRPKVSLLEGLKLAYQDFLCR